MESYIYRNKLQNRSIEYSDYSSSFPKAPLSHETRLRIIKILLNEVSTFLAHVSPSSTKPISSIESEKPSNDCLDTFEGVGGHLHMFLRVYDFLKGSSLSTEERKFLQEEASRIGRPELAKPEYFVECAHASLKAGQALAQIIMEEDFQRSRRIYISFCFGVTSYFYHLAIYGMRVGDEDSVIKALRILQKYTELITSSLRKFLGEVLYGLSGFLFMILDLHHKIHQLAQWPFKTPAPSLADAIWSIVQGIFTLGTEQNPSKLTFVFHKKIYFGGAHGSFGVYCLLSQAFAILGPVFEKNPSFGVYLRLLAASIDADLAVQYPSGNFPSSFPVSGSDSMVQFCHGIPGVGPALVAAYKLFKDQRYLEAVKNGSVVIEKYGALLKGWGLCHGISGNAYCLLSLFKATESEEYLRLACGFGLLKENQIVQKKISNHNFEDRHVVGISDYPFSLYLGLAGDICFLVDLLQPKKAGFPGYEITN